VGYSATATHEFIPSSDSDCIGNCLKLISVNRFVLHVAKLAFTWAPELTPRAGNFIRLAGQPFIALARPADKHNGSRMKESREIISLAEVDLHPVLSQLPPTLKQRAADRARVVKLKRAEPLFQQGDPAGWIYFCRSGLVKLFRLSSDGDEKIVNLINAGRSFAEATMFMPGRCYPVHCSSLRVSELIAYDAEDLVQMFKMSPDLCFNMLGMLSRRLHEQIGQIEALSLQSAQTRIANYLLSESLKAGNSGRFELPIGKKYVANFLSVKPETFSRAITSLEQAGILSTDARKFRLMDVPALERIARGVARD